MLPLEQIATMKLPLTLCLMVFLASIETLSAQYTLKIRGKEPALVVRVLQVVEQELNYADFVTQETGSVSISKIERLFIKEEARRIQLSNEDSDLKKLILASSGQDFVKKMIEKDNSETALMWNKHLIKASTNYNGAVVLDALSLVVGAVPNLSNTVDPTISQAVTCVSLGLGVGSLVLYLIGNGHLRKAGEKATHQTRIGMGSNPAAF